MFEEYYKLVGLNVIYLLQVEPGFYKFGITGNIYKRLQTHRRTLKFADIIGVFQCPSKQSSFRIEQKFKRFARNEGILVNRYGKTEIICAQEPQKYTEWFLNEIREETRSLGLLAIVDDVDFAPRIPKLRLRFDLRALNFTQTEINTPINAPKIRRFARRQDAIVKATKIPKNHNCERCGAFFKMRKHLDQHKRRTTPCGIIEDKGGNNRCVYCNKTYSNKYNLAQHSKICNMKGYRSVKAKDIATQLVEQMKIMREKEEEWRKEKEKRDREIAEIKAKLDELLARPVINVNNINNGPVNIYTQNIDIDNRYAPDVESPGPEDTSMHLCDEDTIIAALMALG